MDHSYNINSGGGRGDRGDRDRDRGYGGHGGGYSGSHGGHSSASHGGERGPQMMQERESNVSRMAPINSMNSDMEAGMVITTAADRMELTQLRPRAVSGQLRGGHEYATYPNSGELE